MGTVPVIMPRNWLIAAGRPASDLNKSRSRTLGGLKAASLVVKPNIGLDAASRLR